MAITGRKKTYFVVWTRVGDPFIELIHFDQDHWDKIRNNLMIFFKSFVLDVLLGLKTLFVCPIFDKSGIDYVEYPVQSVW